MEFKQLIREKSKMPRNNYFLLVLDEDKTTLELLKTILEKENYSVDVSTSAEIALTKIEKLVPDLIISELQLADVSGFEFLEAYHKTKHHHPIPVIILTNQHDPALKLKALELGAKAYIAKPFHRDNLITCIRKILGRKKISQHFALKRNSEISEIISQFQKNNISKISPQVDNLARCGYSYPRAVHLSAKKDLSDLFNAIVENGYLSTSLIDVVHLCPRCEHHDINIRELCPHCQSFNLQIESFFIHTPCQTIIKKALPPKPEYIFCPACDLKYPAEHPDFQPGFAYRCHNCHRLSREIDINCRCLKCGHEFEITEAIKKEIFEYHLESRRIEIASANAAQYALLKNALKANPKIYLSTNLFKKKIDLEILRAKRHKTSATIIAIEFQKFIDLIENYDASISFHLYKNVILLINHSLRETDSISLKNNSQLLILLPNTHQNLAKIIGHKILKDLEKFHHSIQLEIRLASFPEDGENGDEIINILDLGLEQLKENM